MSEALATRVISDQHCACSGSMPSDATEACAIEARSPPYRRRRQLWPLVDEGHLPGGSVDSGLTLSWLGSGHHSWGRVPSPRSLVRPPPSRASLACLAGGGEAATYQRNLL
jgi:hypothetical protein